ncbi:MAG: hypothetical protein ACNA8P_07910, partial [Phycisphaerales bacterium]
PRPLQCEACKGRFEPLSRQATQNAMGPWQIRDAAQPFRPPCSYETIVRLAQRGRITADTIVRGPTTRQFWTYARDTPGIGAILGHCHACHTAVSPHDAECPSCKAILHPKTDRQQLGLSPRAMLPGEASPEQIVAIVRPQTPQAMPTGQPEPPSPPPPVAADPRPESIPEPPTDPLPTSTPRSRAKEQRATPRWLGIVIGVQGAAIFALVILLLVINQNPTAAPTNDRSTASSAQPSVPPQQAPDSTRDEAPDAEPAFIDPPADEPDARDLDTLMDSAMRPFERRYWPIVEATRSDQTDTLARAVTHLRALRTEAGAADPDATFPLTDDLIEQAEQRLSRLRLLDQFAESP